MHKLYVGIGWSVLKLRLSPWIKDSTKIWAKLDQHIIINSEKLKEYYLLKAEEDGFNVDLVQQFFAESYYEDDSFINVKDFGSSNIGETFSHFLKNKSDDDKILIFEEADDVNCSKKICRYQYTIYDAVSDEVGPLAMYSIPIKRNVYKHDDGKWYIRWLKNMLEKEINVNIIDQYITNAKGIQVIKDYLVNVMDYRATVNLHIANDVSYEVMDSIKEYLSNYVKEVHIFTYNNMHDRHIITEHFQIDIQLGLDFIDKDEARKNTSILVNELTNSQKKLGAFEYSKKIAGDYYKQFC